ncbi:MAG: hypothetical protein Q4A27_00600 [bacterium]|nr:hypothetical protein [bacterium]
MRDYLRVLKAKKDKMPSAVNPAKIETKSSELRLTPVFGALICAGFSAAEF